MAWWPFGRKKRKEQRAQKAASLQIAQIPSEKAQVSSVKGPVGDYPLPPSQPHTQYITTGPPHFEAKPSQPAATSPTFIKRQVNRQPSRDDAITALPLSPRVDPPLPASPQQLRQIKDSELNIAAQEPGLVRRKSSKRHPDDHQREEELKAMTQPIPIPKRAGADSPHIFRRESKKRKGDISVVSFNSPTSARSSMTGMSDSHRIGVGIADILSPRPTLRYSLQAAPGATRSSAPSRSDSKRPMSKRTIKDGKRIDDYADEMDTRTLRELMERDQRRSDRRRRSEDDKARRRLERLAARGEAEDSSWTVAHALFDFPLRGVPGPRRVTRNIFNDIQEPGPSGQTKEYQIGPSLDSPSSPNRRVERSPFDDPAERREPPLELHPALRGSASATPATSYHGHPSPPMSPTHVRYPSSTTQATDPRSQGLPYGSETASFGRRDSQTASVKRGGALAALLRRSGLGGRRTSAAAPRSESSFSNTSRESMTRSIPALPIPSPISKPSGSTGPGQVPRRTMSKFREDLPESPLSPPDSRYQSPEMVERTPVPSLPRELSAARLEGEGYPTQGGQEMPQHELYETSGGPSADLLSQSLASVDSEASWLAGGRSKNRASQQTAGTRSSLRQPLEAPADGDLERTRDSTGAPYPPRNESINPFADGQMIRETVSRRPTIVHRDERVQSQEGLLNQFDGSAGVTPSDADYYETASEMESPDLMVGQSAIFEYASPPTPLQHARSVSAGSAILLDIPALRGDASKRSSGVTPPLHGRHDAGAL